MNKDKIAGGVQRTLGEAEAEAARAARDHGLRAEGLADQAKGAAREALGEAKDAASRAADWVSERVAPIAQRVSRPMDDREVKDALYDAGMAAVRFVRERPLAALGIMAAVAYVMGRTSRDPYHKRGLWR